MAFWLIFAIVVSLSIGFVMGARFTQYVQLGGKHKDGGFRHSHSPPVPMPPPPPSKASERIEAKLDVLIQQTRKTQSVGPL